MNKLVGVVLVLAGFVSAFGQSSGGNRGGGGSIASGTTGQNAVYTSASSIGASTVFLDCSKYSGATVDVKWNACNTDAIAAGAVADGRALAGNQTIAAQLNCGDSAGDPATCLLPVSGTWTATVADGTSCAMKSWGNSSLIGYPASGQNLSFSFRSGGSANLAYVYCTDSASAHYLSASGFGVFAAAGVNAITANGIGAYFSDTFDSSTFSYITVNDRVDTYAAKIQRACCTTVFDHIQFQSNFTAGLTPLWISQLDNELKTQSLTISNSSINHPGATFPSIKITDVSAAHFSSINLLDDYIEPSNTDTTTAIINVSGAGAVNIDNLTIHCMAAGSTASAVAVDNTAATLLNVNGLSYFKGGANCTYPVVAAIADSSSGTTINTTTDATGNISSFNNSLNYRAKQTIYGTTTNQLVLSDPDFLANLSLSAVDAGSGAVNINFDPKMSTNQTVNYRFNRNVNSTGTVQVQFFPGNNTSNVPFQINSSSGTIAVGDTVAASKQTQGASACETTFGITTLSTGGTTTNTGLNCLPANAVIDAVVYRITTAIATATNFTVGDATIAARFCATQSTLTLGATGICFAQADQTGTSGPRQTAAAAVRITTTGTPSAGAIRLIVYYHTWTAPTS